MKRFLNNFKKLMHLAWVYDKNYFLYIIIGLISTSIFSYLIINIPKFIIVMVETQQIDTTSIIVVFCLLLVSAFFAAMARVWYIPTGTKIRYELMHQVMLQYISIPYETYEEAMFDNSLWTVIRPLTGPIGTQSFYTGFAQFVSNLGVLIVSIIMLWRVQPLISLFIIVWFIIYTNLSIKASDLVQKNYDDNNHLYEEDRYLQDISLDVAYGKELRVFKLQDWLKNKQKILRKKQEKLDQKNHKIQVNPILLNDIYQFIRDTFVYVLLITLYFSGNITLGDFSSFSILVFQLNGQ